MATAGGMYRIAYYEIAGGARPAASIRAMLVNSYWGDW